MTAPIQALSQPTTQSTKCDLVISRTVVISFSEPASSARCRIRVQDPEEAAVPVTQGKVRKAEGAGYARAFAFTLLRFTYRAGTG